MRASRLAALVGESEGVDVEPTAASSCIRTAGIEGKHDRRSSVGAGRDDEETAGPANSRRPRPIPSTRRYLTARRSPWRSSICSPVPLAAAPRRRARRLHGSHPREESRWGRVGEQESMSGRGEREGSVVRPCPPRGGGGVGHGSEATAAWRQGPRSPL